MLIKTPILPPSNNPSAIAKKVRAAFGNSAWATHVITDNTPHSATSGIAPTLIRKSSNTATNISIDPDDALYKSKAASGQFDWKLYFPSGRFTVRRALIYAVLTLGMLVILDLLFYGEAKGLEAPRLASKVGDPQPVKAP
jgi:hypothetical protein